MKYPWYEYVIMTVPIAVGLFGGYRIVRKNWWRYGLLYLLSGFAGTGLCLFFTLCDFYRFPDNPLHGQLLIPYAVMLTFIPFTVVAGVRYSPRHWPWKVPFYWGIVHLAATAELLLTENTRIFRFVFGWDLWTSYTWWWIFYLVFEYVGGRLVPTIDRKPMKHVRFRYGHSAWLVFHTIVISTIFLFGMYVGKLIWDR